MAEHNINTEERRNVNNINRRYVSGISMFASTIFILVALFFLTPALSNFIEFLLTIRCIFPNNYIIYEATRPLSNCLYCKNLKKPIIIKNISFGYDEYHQYASQPIIIKGAVSEWPASKVLNYSYVKELYLRNPKALDTECQFLNFRSNLFSLKDVFQMSKERVENKEEPWYVGFSNCDPEVLAQLRTLYPNPPPFLPFDTEVPNTDYIFMGYDEGVIIMHTDFMSRLMWQGQLRGNKTWILTPSPDCDYECSSFSFYVEAGDAVLIDSRLWYYGTYIAKGEFSINIQSEYG